MSQAVDICEYRPTLSPSLSEGLGLLFAFTWWRMERWDDDCGEQG
jgi:hypothetical protein